MSLVHEDMMPFYWDSLKIPGLVRKRTPMDGSCFFHAICDSFYDRYKQAKLGNTQLSPGQIVSTLRKELADKLGSKVNPLISNSPTFYDILSRGKLKDFGKDLKTYSLPALQEWLASNRSVDNAFNEFISNLLGKDIYILDYNKKDVYITGDDMDLLYSQRPGIVLLYLQSSEQNGVGHYELVGRVSRGKIITMFDPNDPLILQIQDRMRSKLEKG